MNDVIHSCLCQFVLVFLDDILVYSNTWADHLGHVCLVFEKLHEYGLVAKRSKCTFGQTQVEYRGHIVSPTGLVVDPMKVEAIRAWLVPTTIKGVRGFLGLAGYYRRFIKGFTIIAAPLSDLLRNGKMFEWSESTQ
ncbi:hypothetical protein HRI_003139900 [Hibiscus trionum]|uniref:Reverse transcriptase domain-containing protein n=1 Tax=Hibiscus trionum TaxID=183268 RepID=A0A9W7IGJ7_HIBTR|nr:hypothetical protein HRI_003139900 [Hibiscus trionum]